MDAFVKDVIDTAIESYQETIGGKHGMFYVLPRLLPVDTRKELSQEDGIHMYVMASEYAPELKRSCILVEDWYYYLYFAD